MALSALAAVALPFGDRGAPPDRFSAVHILALDPELGEVDVTRSLQVYGRLAETDEIFSRVLQAMSPETPERNQIDVELSEDETSLSIAATDEDPAQAVAIADTVAAELLGFLADEALTSRSRDENRLTLRLESLEAQILDARQRAEAGEALASLELDVLTTQYSNAYSELVNTRVSRTEDLLVTVQPAVAAPVSDDEFRPPTSTPARLALGLLLGAIVGVALALGIERVDPRVRRNDDVTEVTGADVIGEVPVIPSRWKRGVVAHTMPRSNSANAFRALATYVRLVPRPVAVNGVGEHSGDLSNVIVVTSARPGAGATTVSANLAACLAETGVSTLVVDCTGQPPTAAERLATPTHAGFAEFVHGADLAGNVVRTGIRNVSLIGPGVAPLDIGAAMGRASVLVAELRPLADAIVIDAGPLLTDTLASQLVSVADGVIVVARAGTTTPEDLERVHDRLTQLRAAVVGVVLNASPDTPSDGWLHRSVRRVGPSAVDASVDDGSGADRTEGSDPSEGEGEQRRVPAMVPMIGEHREGAGDGTG